MADDDLPLDLLRVVREHFPGVPDADLSVALRNRLDGGPDLDAEAELHSNEALRRELAERVKELTALHRASLFLHRNGTQMEEELQQLAGMVPCAFQYPELTTARLDYARVSFATPGFERTPWFLSATARGGEGEGRIEVAYSADPSGIGTPFLAEEKSLLESLVGIMISGIDSVLARERIDLARAGWGFNTFEWRPGSHGDTPAETHYSTMAGLPPGRWYGAPRVLEDFDQHYIERSTAEVAAIVRGERPGDVVSFETLTLTGQWRWCVARLFSTATGNRCA